MRVAPDGQRAYVVAGRTCTVVDVRARTLVANVDLGAFPAHGVRGKS